MVTELEPDDPRRDCPWKCSTDNPLCLCMTRKRAEIERENQIINEALYGFDDYGYR